MSETGNELSEPIGTDPATDNPGGDSESYHGYSVDDEDQPQDTGDSLVDDDRGISDPLDEGYNPREGWSAAQGFGNTPLEEALGETLDQRIAQEIPEPDPYVLAEQEAELADSDENAELTEVGDERAGRLVAPDQGVLTDVDSELLAEDVGIDGAAAGAEEAAVHVIPE